MSFLRRLLSRLDSNLHGIDESPRTVPVQRHTRPLHAVTTGLAPTPFTGTDTNPRSGCCSCCKVRFGPASCPLAPHRRSCSICQDNAS